MKTRFLLSVLSLGACISLICCTPRPAETQSALEQRLDTLLAAMSMQEKIEQLYYKTDGNDRLGIPQFTGSDGPHGIGNGAPGFSCFPVTIALAATWDPDLVLRVGRAIAMEQAARGRDRIAGPTLDLLADPRIGRAPETFGEDPYLGSRISEAFVLGQNSTSVFGTIKHYNLNTYELNRRTNNYLCDERSLAEFWGYHWKRTIQQGGALSVMCAYNWVNGDKCAENRYLIKHLLRDHWGFGFYTMSDWGGFSETAKALQAELDFCEGNDLYIKELPEGLASGRFDSALVERAARNVLRTKIVSGMIDGVPAVPESVIDGEAHRQLVYESGLKGLVLLKNEGGILPLRDDRAGRVAVIGPNAAVLPLDGYSSSRVIPSYRITVLDALRKTLGEDRVRYARGCNIHDDDRSRFREAVEAARQSELVLFVAGQDSTVEGEGYFLDPEADERGGGAVTRPDRRSGTVLLPGLQNELIREIAQVNPNIVLVVITGGPCSVSPVLDHIKGLLYAFYPGQEGGRAIADVLFGRYNPSGKLPATIPVDDGQIRPITPDFRQVVHEGVGYRWFDARKLTPGFAFGYGLSYTTFDYSDLKIDKSRARTGDAVQLSFTLTNTGALPGAEVAQLYLSSGQTDPVLPMPEKQLRGFEKVFLKPGESRELVMTLGPEELYVYEEAAASYRVPSGHFRVRVGGSSDHLPLSAEFALEEAPGVPDLSLCNIRTLPAFPAPGDRVVFMVSIVNNGTAPIRTGDAVHVRFRVDDAPVAHFYSEALEIPVGGMALACAGGAADETWRATEGSFVLTASLESGSGTGAADLDDSCTARLMVPGGKAIPEVVARVLEPAPDR
jgi:beta-glucosidase